MLVVDSNVGIAATEPKLTNQPAWSIENSSTKEITSLTGLITRILMIPTMSLSMGKLDSHFAVEELMDVVAPKKTLLFFQEYV